MWLDNGHTMILKAHPELKNKGFSFHNNSQNHRKYTSRHRMQAWLKSLIFVSFVECKSNRHFTATFYLYWWRKIKTWFQAQVGTSVKSLTFTRLVVMEEFPTKNVNKCYFTFCENQSGGLTDSIKGFIALLTDTLKKKWTMYLNRCKHK
jgi:hypothetical protein